MEFDDGEGGQWFAIDRVLSHRFIKLGRRNVTQYLVKWKGYGDEWNEWRDEVGVTDVATQEYWARVGGRSAPPPHLHKRKRGSRAGKKPQQARKAKMAASSLVLISDAGAASHWVGESVACNPPFPSHKGHTKDTRTTFSGFDPRSHP